MPLGQKKHPDTGFEMNMSGGMWGVEGALGPPRLHTSYVVMPLPWAGGPAVCPTPDLARSQVVRCSCPLKTPPELEKPTTPTTAGTS